MKIMVCFDGSDAAARALQYAVKRAAREQAELVVAYSLQAEQGTAHLYANEIQAAGKDLEKIASMLKTAGVPFQTQLLQRGLVAGEDLVLFARENGVQEMVIGVRKRSRVGKLLLGSVAQYVILNAGLPVVSV